MRYKNLHQLLVLFLVLFFVSILVLPAVFHLFKSGFFATHDGEWMIIRFSAFYDAFREGQFPVRWLGRLNSLYGYPAPNFAYPLFMYLAIPIHAVGFGIVNSIKILIILSFIFSAIFTYFWLKRFFRTDVAILGAVVYTYTPYHLYNLYTRGSVGEIVALTVLPFLLWQIERGSAFFIAIGVAALMLSHNILAFLFLPLVVVYTLLTKNLINKTLRAIIAEYIPFVFGLGLSAFFIIPAIYDLQYIIFQKAKLAAVTTNFVSFQLFGYVSLLILLAASVLLFQIARKQGFPAFKNNEFRLLVFFTLIGWITWFLTNPVSTVVWKILPTTILQYPFRLLSLLPIVVAFLSAYSIARLPKHRLPMVIIAGVAMFVTCIPYLTPKEFFDRGDMYYANNFATTTVSNEYTPRWVQKQIFYIPDAKVKVSSGEVVDLVNKSHITSFTYVATGPARVRINTTYFPGWKIYDNNKEIQFSYNNTFGVMEFDVDTGEHDILARFSETPVRLASDIVSIVSFLFLIGWVVYTSRVRNHVKTMLK